MTAGKHVRYILMAENMLESYIIQLPHALCSLQLAFVFFPFSVSCFGLYQHARNKEESFDWACDDGSIIWELMVNTLVTTLDFLGKLFLKMKLCLENESGVCLLFLNHIKQNTQFTFSICKWIDLSHNHQWLEETSRDLFHKDTLVHLVHLPNKMKYMR